MDSPVASPAVDLPVDLPSIAPHPAREPEPHPPEARHHVDESALDLPSIDLSEHTPRGAASRALASEPEAQPGALEAAALMRDIARKSGDADVEAAAAEVAAMLQQTALEGGIKKKSKGVSVMATQLARMLGGEEPSGGDEASEEQASAAKLPDETLAAIAETLRKYPEVEWACDLSAARGQASVGVRVDPSFLTRIDQITEATLTAAAPNEIDIEVLTDAAKMRKARSEGTVFFPWKGKR